ncbi:hypothetical protein K034_3536, partial [Acinetobacter baumannii 42057_3]
MPPQLKIRDEAARLTSLTPFKSLTFVLNILLLKYLARNIVISKCTQEVAPA